VEEKKAAELPEDVEVTDVCIPATRSMSDHVLYQIDVSNARKRKTFSKWTVLKRFGQFYEMDTEVRASFAEEKEFLDTLPCAPERKPKLLADHMDSTFIEERRALLEHYLQAMIKVERIVRHPTFLQFLGVNV
jgi:PX domain